MRNVFAVWLGLVFLIPGAGRAQVDESVVAQVRDQRAPLIDTMRELVSIESGSRDFDGLSRIAGVIAGRLRALGGDVELVDAADIYAMQDTPAQIGQTVVARFRGTGTRRILLLAHMDTVYLKGMLAEQPFRLDGNRAYGLGIADDKHGVALILHTVATLNALGFDDYGLITVLINADEEVSSPGSRSLITALWVVSTTSVFSCEGGRPGPSRPPDGLRGSARSSSPCAVERHTLERRPSEGLGTRCMSSPTRSCRPATCQNRRLVSR